MSIAQKISFTKPGESLARVHIGREEKKTVVFIMFGNARKCETKLYFFISLVKFYLGCSFDEAFILTKLLTTHLFNSSVQK